MEVTDSSLDKRIKLAENRVLLYQARVIEQKEAANLQVKRLERETQALEEIKKEWIKKRNCEEERNRLELEELKKAHRHTIEDLRVKFERERESKLVDLKAAIREEEKEIREWQRKRADESLKTQAEEAEIKQRYQGRINDLLREEQASSRRGVVRQKRILETGLNVYSMSLDRNQGVGMKRRAYQRRGH